MKRDEDRIRKNCFSGLASQVRDKLRPQLDDIKLGVDQGNGLLKKQEEMLQRLAKGLDRSLAALSLLAAQQVKECPNLVCSVPISVGKPDW